MSNFVAYILVVNSVMDIEVLASQALATAFGEMEARVGKILTPSYAGLEVAPYRRECDCLWHNALEEAKNLPEWKVKGASFVFTRDEFSKPGFELGWRRKVLELGSPDSSCDECGGSGIVYSRDNPGEKWESFEIGAGPEAVLQGCVKGQPPDLNVVPVKDLDLQKVPAPHHIVTPDGKWISANEFIWFFNAVVVDENWEETAKQVLEDHKDATLVVVNIHT